MGILRKNVAVLLLVLSCYDASGQLNGAQTDINNRARIKQRVPQENKTERSNKMLGAAQISPRIGAVGQNTVFNAQNLETFNRPEGTESLVRSLNKNQRFETTYGRNFGQYGSYKKHKSWQEAVAQDRQRHIAIPEDLKTKFPWLINKLHLPSVHGFGLNGFWNSYAVPEGTPDVKGLGPAKFGQQQFGQR
ncbi:uncharacterized protein LOC123547516 [Mercenaria mercenaria]|uniref:uncharacterized protein LOC123547516 n=1 Tax=Mercenaria mercenaria TaxID=6596 RepID=UPI00234F0185|nr:uncharacterized protein LOC123547516 [Mercenaria mercenaria]